MRKLLIQVSQAHGVSVHIITGRGRVAHAVEARREFCKLAQKAGYSLPAIARAINRDHTTVLHFVRSCPPA
jgi:chromosomal replication initiation ATPase DnaA